MQAGRSEPVYRLGITVNRVVPIKGVSFIEVMKSAYSGVNLSGNCKPVIDDGVNVNGPVRFS